MITNKHRSMIIAWMRRRGVSQQDAEDIAQETLLRAWLKYETQYSSSVGSFEKWLIGIACHIRVDRYRRAIRRPFEDLFELAANTPDEGTDPTIALKAAELERSLAKLRPVYRDAIELVLEGYSHEEMVSILKIPLGTVKSHTKRGMKELIDA